MLFLNVTIQSMKATLQEQFQKMTLLGYARSGHLANINQQEWWIVHITSKLCMQNVYTDAISFSCTWEQKGFNSTDDWWQPDYMHFITSKRYKMRVQPTLFSYIPIPQSNHVTGYCKWGNKNSTANLLSSLLEQIEQWKSAYIKKNA